MTSMQGADRCGGLEQTDAVWDGITEPHRNENGQRRQELADMVKQGSWELAFGILEQHPDLLNSSRTGGQSLYAPLHQAAYGGVAVTTAERLVGMGAWRTLCTAKAERAVDIAMRQGHRHLLGILEPVYKRSVPGKSLSGIQARFHTLIHKIAGELVTKQNLRLPELEVMLEFESRRFWFPVPGMYGGFLYSLDVNESEPRLTVQSWRRVVQGSGMHHDITPSATILIDAGVV
jgi:hypothetical protein